MAERDLYSGSEEGEAVRFDIFAKAVDVLNERSQYAEMPRRKAAQEFTALRVLCSITAHETMLVHTSVYQTQPIETKQGLI